MYRFVEYSRENTDIDVVNDVHGYTGVVVGRDDQD